MKELFADAASGKPVTEAVGEGEADRRAAEDALTQRSRWPWPALSRGTGRRLRRPPMAPAPRAGAAGAHRPGARPSAGRGRGAPACRTCCSLPPCVLELADPPGADGRRRRDEPLELTQFHIRDWSTAPWSGSTTTASPSTSTAPIGKALLHSFWITCAFTVLVGRPVLAARHCRGGRSCRAVPGPGAAARAVPHPVRAAGLRGRDHLGVHVPARHRPGQPRARRPAAPDGRAGRSG